MTDAEKELRAHLLASQHRGASEREKRRAWAHLWAKCTPSAVLALLGRIEALETQLRCEHWEEREYCAKAFNEAVDRAERKGAEEMREKAEDALYIGDPLDERPEYAERIRNLPLPGDVP